MTSADWDDRPSQALMLHLYRHGTSPAHAHAVLLLFNPQPQPVRFEVPPGEWRLGLDSASGDASGTGEVSGIDRLLCLQETVPAGALWLAVAESTL